MHRVFVGFRCNNRCSFCAQGDLRDRDVEDRVESDLAEVTPGSVVAFVGGEPTLHDPLTRWVARARELGAREVVVQTNGRRLSARGYAEALERSGVTRLDVSLHGSTAPMHEFHTTVPGSFEETTLGIREASVAGLAVGVTVVVTRSNFRHLPEIVRLSATLGARAVHLTVAQPLGRVRGSGASPVPPATLLKPHWTRALATARELGLPCFAAFAEPGDLSLGARWFAGLGVVDGGLPVEARPPGPAGPVGAELPEGRRDG